MIIKVKNISKYFSDSNFKIENLSFNVNDNEVLGIIGPNGCGKSTILKIINGLIKFDAGEIIYNDKEVSKMNKFEKRIMKKDVSYIFQNSNLLETKTVYYHLSLIYKLNKEPIDKEKIDNILKFMNIYDFKNTTCKNLSGGQKQRVAIAMSILQNPKVILCDEISSSLDTDSEKEVFELLMKLKKTLNISIIIVSHNLAILKNFCDRVILMDKSKIRDIIIPVKPRENDYNKDYFNYLKEFLLND